ncbi:VPS9 domain-containing protein [Madurella fahalii]|uniref:VPS9 domain-containing protein n=1 Tax=Madurella fahalii TaxID=1157608 RepID=A0ABQ0G2U6_9PEZI
MRSEETMMTPSGIRKKASELTRAEVSWNLRVGQEGSHRWLAQMLNVTTTYNPPVDRLDDLPQMSQLDLADTCNKTVPVYVVRQAASGAQWPHLAVVLHNYIYRRWFRPYRSELERGRFLCKFVTPVGLGDRGTGPFATQPILDTFVAVNKAVCAQVERTQAEFSTLDLDSDYRWWDARGSRQFYVLQPLFRALLVVVCTDAFEDRDSGNAGDMPVLLVRTSEEQGLSAPISFDSIRDHASSSYGENDRAVKTTLETAVDFAMGLEAREAAVFGLQPDPAAAAEAEGLIAGLWKECFPDDEPPRVSTARLVSDRHAAQWGWCGDGRSMDDRVMVQIEQRTARMHGRKSEG